MRHAGNRYLDLIGVLGIDRVFLAGLSLGGWIAAQVAVLAWFFPAGYVSRIRRTDPRDQGRPWLERGYAVAGMKRS